uniref:Putative ovule protein n=1 Tax=Solanum chacoense TaxID=4108 RepID=A0A0V0GSG9_SOLCH
MFAASSTALIEPPLLLVMTEKLFKVIAADFTSEGSNVSTTYSSVLFLHVHFPFYVLITVV